MFKKLVLSSLLVLSFNVSAHEGHDSAPGTLIANHGGVVKPGKQVNLEYVISGSIVKLYPVGHDGKDLSSDGLKVTATTKSPKGKAEAAKLEMKDGVYLAKVDFKGAYRTEMIVTVDDKGKSSVFKFQVEK